MGRISELQKTRLLDGLNVLCLWGDSPVQQFFSAAKHAMAKLISFTEDFTLKKKILLCFSINLNLQKL